MFKKIFKRKKKKNLKKLDKILHLLDDIKNKEEYNIEEQLINIIIRTHNRPKFFERNFESIKKLNYSNLKIFISYENDETLQYIKNNIDNMENVTLVHVVKTNDPAFYNNYCNTILDLIDDGFNIFLDDDDMFTHPNCLKYINKFLKKDRLLCWEYLRADKIIGPIKGQITNGQITSCGFCYHSSYKSEWVPVRGGDHLFVKKLIEVNKLNVGKIKTILTRSISLEIINGEGLSNDYSETISVVIDDIVDEIIDQVLEKNKYNDKANTESIEMSKEDKLIIKSI